MELSTFTVVLLTLGWVLTPFFIWTSWALYRKAVTYDEIFQYLAGDINVNLATFVKINQTPVLSNDDVIQDAHQKMIVMGKRLEEISLRMSEATGLDLRPPPPPRRPKVV